MLTRQSPVVGIIAVLITALCITWLVYYYMTNGRSQRGYTWWYDTGNNTLYTIRENLWPPVEAPSGKEAVKAVIYAKTDCFDMDDRFVMYLQKYTDEGRLIMLDPNTTIGIAQATSENMMLVRTLDETEWVLRKRADRDEIIADKEEELDLEVIPCGASFKG
jgi:hypothetical protein